MDIYEARNELKRMRKGRLFELAANQRISKCLIGDGACVFYLCYGGFHFCVSELLGQSCQIERAEISEGHYGDLEEIHCSLPFTELPGAGPFRPERRTRKPQFKVYYLDEVTRSIILLGKVVERRTKERGNNLRDLLTKAVQEFSDCVTDPSAIFLLGPSQ